MIRANDTTIRVLVVEDNSGGGRHIPELLRDAGPGRFSFEIVDRVERALEHLRAAPFDVVLLDLDLPDSKGLETFERLHRAPPNLPIVVISGMDDERTALDAVRAGAQDYLVKGHIDGHVLARVLRYAIERKRTEQWIHRLSIAVDQSPAAVIITDPAGTIEYVNARFTDTTGYAAAEAIGGNPRMLQSGLTPPDVYRDLWTTIMHGDPWRGEILNRRKDGTLYWDDVWVSPIRDAGGRVTHFLALQEDVTERRATIEALREREERFRQVTEGIREVYFLSDADFREMLFVSPAYEKIWGRSRESLYRAPASFIEAVVAEDRPALFEHIDRIRAGGEPEQCEYRIVRPDGSVRWILVKTGGVRNEEGVIYRLAGVALDFTERKNAEEALRASEQRLRTLFETVNLIVLALDAGGRVEYVNPFLLKLTGYAREEVFGADWIERFIPEAHRPNMRGVFRDTIEQLLHPHYQNPILTRTGEERLISWHNTVVRDAQGRPTGTLSVGEDVTEHAQLEAQLRQSQKMEAVGRLAGGVAHDFNNLLTVILGTADLMLFDTPATDPRHAELGEIRSAGERAAGLTRQLLALSRQQVLEVRVVDLNDLIQNVERLLRRVIGEDVHLRTLPGVGLGAVRADPGQIEQVILNLAINSRDAMPDGGTITIETANVELDETYAATHSPVEPGPYAMLAVSDTGIGMSAATRAQIFEPFFTTKPMGKGTGLGLATVHGIVNQSGGHIWVYSEPGQGTTFKIYLPRVDETIDEATTVGARSERLAGTELILVVEDDDTVRAVTSRMLEARGYRVLLADAGAEALTLVEQDAGQISLLISDVVMPDMSGRELANRVAQIRPDMHVLFVSGYTDETIAYHGVLEQGVNFLQKPFTPDALARTVRRILDS
jgi:PAS domain S-box-containing protein